MLWSDVASLTFTRVNTDISGKYAEAEQADLILGNFTTGPAVSYSGGWGTWRYYYNPFPTEERHMGVWIDGSEADLRAPVQGQRSEFLYIHEIGHALTLSHPGDYNVAPGVTITYNNNAEYIEDSYQYTVMSYFLETSTGADYGGIRPMTPMLHDIAAIQKMYGANMDTRDGDTTYGFNPADIDADLLGIYGMTKSNFRRVFSIWDGKGTDELDFSGLSTGSIIGLREGGFSSVGGLKKNISIAFGAEIENAIGGSGNDTIYGNDAANDLDGNGGNDTLFGFLGNDTLDGDTGVDTASYAILSDGKTPAPEAVTVDLSSGTASGVGIDTDTLIAIENVIGSAGNDTINGNELASRIEGGAGDDTFHIKWGEGADKISDFLSGTDEIELDLLPAQAVPLSLEQGSNHLANVVAPALVYDTDDGKLYYDSGPGAPVLIATLTDKATLDFADFTFV